MADRGLTSYRCTPRADSQSRFRGQLRRFGGDDWDALSHAVAHQDLATPRLRLESRSGVDNLADRREVPQPAVSDVPDERCAEVDPNAHLDERALFSSISDGREEPACVLVDHAAGLGEGT